MDEKSRRPSTGRRAASVNQMNLRRTNPYEQKEVNVDLTKDNAIAEPRDEAANSDRGDRRYWQIAPAAIVGTIVEYFDFGIYGYMAVMLSAQFFVAEDDTAALLGTFAAFAVAFLLRIPGGIFFGHIGDKYGRKTALTWTILLMVLATALIGILPTYATIGLWATVMLVFCRCLQGFSAGGELTGANIFVAESAPRKWRGLQTSTVNLGTAYGSLLASLVALALTTLFTPEEVLEWGWRLAFLVSLPLGIVGFWIRRATEESPRFQEMKAQNAEEKVPLAVLLRTSKMTVLKATGLTALITGGYYIATVYAATYLQTAGGLTPSDAFLSTSIALVAGSLMLPLAGALSDIIGRKVVLFIGAGGAALLGIPMFILMQGGELWQGIVGQSVLFMLVSFTNGASFVTFVEMFKTSVRYSGIALSQNIALMVLGGTAPFIATWLISLTGDSLTPGWYFVGCALLSFVSVFAIKESRGKALIEE